MIMRSKLFVPGSRPEFFDKALRSAADALTLDLEDAVAPEQKPAARRTISDFLGRLDAGHGKLMTVRVNHVDHPGFLEDIDAAVSNATHYINLPKLESADEVQRAAIAISSAEARKGVTQPIGLLVNVETPGGLRIAHEIAAADKRVAALQFGLADLFAPLRIARRDEALAPVRMRVKMAAAEAGIACYDTVWVDVRDTLGFERDARNALAMGFLGKSCIHPSQVAIANAVFTPTDAAIRSAQRVLEAAADPTNAGKGAFTVDGQMVDEPFFREARATVALARHLKLIS